MGGTERDNGGDGWIVVRGLMCLNPRTWQVKPLDVTFAHCLPVLGATNLLSATEPRTES